ncbi:sigma-E processing peptidase SpoIIGA [Tepidibacillus fermentans]|uniref:Sporulation sigma-E factor-processing peptidase n=1 Tax=Tepidibacillus fermentans TaxID=1281767 RepID=A0A4R3KKS1_9BACI|nr:sigma-E processing peptidase SpoIIGA [Tepidibacillus fermentans]TCS84404.1 stage II sporulation protein GA (sporulation sigma-E factor processing peptidase) [Tepidibacillus fermentans]
MVFYADLIFLFNLVIDYLILWTTGKFLHLKVKKLHLFLSAGIGAFYTFVFLMPALTIFHLLLTKIIVSILMVWISFRFIHLVHFIRAIATFYFVSFVFGGGVFGLQYLLQIDHEIINGIYVTHSSGSYIYFLFLVISPLMVWIFSKKTYHSIERKTSIQQDLVDLELTILDQFFHCKGLVDTGNQLYDPITRKPVLVIEAKDLTFLPDILYQTFVSREFELEKFEQIVDQIDPIWLSRIHLIPFRSVAKEMQFLLALRPDKVVIHNREKLVETNTVLIGLDFGLLSIDRSYQAIIHPELLIAS